MKPETPNISVSSRIKSARRCAATVETIKIPSPEVTAESSAREFPVGERMLDPHGEEAL
jgi:hypothetical protein